MSQNSNKKGLWLWLLELGGFPRCTSTVKTPTPAVAAAVAEAQRQPFSLSSSLLLLLLFIGCGVDDQTLKFISAFHRKGEVCERAAQPRGAGLRRWLIEEHHYNQ